MDGAGSGTQSASDGARVLFGLESSIRAISATEEVSDPRGCGIGCDYLGVFRSGEGIEIGAVIGRHYGRAPVAASRAAWRAWFVA